VLENCDLQVRAGEIHALLGANGAGKSTMCKIIAGLIPPHAGTMTLCGRPYAPANKQSAEAAGVQIVQQELNLIPTLSVAENLLLARLPALAGVICRRQLHARARRALDRFGLHDVSTETPVRALGVGRQQIVEIAAALDRDCKLLILDEPTAALSAAETANLFPWLERLRQQGVGIMYISHRLEEVAQVADRVTILRDGNSIGTRETSELTTEEMVNLMSGGKAGLISGRVHQSYASDPVAMRVAGISRGLVRDVSLTVHRGERLGIAGLVGSGRTEFLRAVFGADVAETGHVYLGESSIPRRFRHPSEAVAAGLAMVTEDRKQNGVLLPQSIRVNTTLSSMWNQFSAAGVIRRQAEEQMALSMCASLETQCTGIEQVVGTLSGGNQQKVAVAKWLVRDADVFLFDEPTRGIDVATRRRIYGLFETLAAAGKGLVIVSSDLDELLETCDRLAVMSAGRVVATFARDNWSHDAIMQAAFSGWIAP
jgi:ribose transport system ATP-binding protein